MQQYEKYNPLKLLLITLQILLQVKTQLIDRGIEHNAITKTSFFVCQKNLQVKLGSFFFASNKYGASRRGHVDGCKNDQAALV